MNWPQHIPRTPPQDRRWSPYRASTDRTWGQLCAEIRDAINRIGHEDGGGASLLEVSTGHKPQYMRMDGVPAANAPEPEDSAVVVSFVLGGDRVDVPADRFHKAKDNARAIWYYLDQMGRSLRDGVGTARAAFEGFMQLPERAGPAEPDEVVQIRAQWNAMTGSGVDAADAFKLLAKKAHPDRPGGSEEAMQELNRLRGSA